MSLQSAHGEKSLCVYVRNKSRACVCLCVRGRETMGEQEHGGGRASDVADIITCLDLSYGKNKTSISHYLPFNQIPTFFASLPQNCHRLKISPFLIKEPRVQLISRLADPLLRNFEARIKREEKTPASPHQANYFWLLIYFGRKWKATF